MINFILLLAVLNDLKKYTVFKLAIGSCRCPIYTGVSFYIVFWQQNKEALHRLKYLLLKGSDLFVLCLATKQTNRNFTNADYLVLCLRSI